MELEGDIYLINKQTNHLNNIVMYFIIDKTNNEAYTQEGDFPIVLIEDMLNKGIDLIIVSTYSDTIKIPYSEEYNGIKEWKYKEYPYPKQLKPHNY